MTGFAGLVKRARRFGNALSLLLSLPLISAVAQPASPAQKAAPVEPASAPASPPTQPSSPDAPPAEDRSKLRDLGQVVEPAETPEPPAPPESVQYRGPEDIPFGAHTVPADRRVGGAVSILGSTTVHGAVESDAVSIGGSTHITSGGRVRGAAVAVFGRVESQGEIRDEAVSVFGGMLINGPVRGDAVSVLGNLELGPKAVIGGDVVVIGGRLIKDPKAVVQGDEVHLSAFDGMPSMDWFTTWLTRCVYLGRPLAFAPNLGWAWAIAFSFLGFYLLLALLFPSGVTRCVETLETRPGYSILASVLTVFLTPVTIVLLALTIVGALLIPFLGLGLLFAQLFGKAVMLAWMGRRITRFFGDGPLGHPVVAVLVGGLIVLLLYTIPVVGFLSFKLLSWLGLGVVVYTVALAMKRESRPAVTLPAGSPPLSPPPAPAPYSQSGFATPAPASVVPTPPVMSAGFGEQPVSAPESPNVPNVAPVPTPPSIETVTPPAASAHSSVPPPPLPPPAPASGFAAPASGPSASFYPRPQPPVSAAITWPRAGLPIRLAALAIDGILIGLIMAFIDGLLPRMLEIDSGPGGWLVALAIYGALMWKHKGTTIGGIVCGLKVVRVDQREVDWPTAIVRALACFLSLAVVGLGFIWVAIDDDKQSWHDKIAGTAVVVVPKGVSLI